MADKTPAELEAEQLAAQEKFAQDERDKAAKEQAKADKAKVNPGVVVQSGGEASEDLRESQAETTEGSVVDGVDKKSIETAYSE